MAAPLLIAITLQAFDKMTAPLRIANSQINKMGIGLKKLQATTARTTVGATNGFKGLATGIIGASIAFAVWDKAILGTIRQGALLEDTLVRAGTKFGKVANVVPGTPGFKALEDAALQAGLTTEFTAVQSAAALDKLSQAGLSLKQSISTLPSVIDFATASGLDLVRATEISTQAIGAFGDDIRDFSPKDLKVRMDELQDIMVVTANTFSTSVEEMFEASTKGGRVLNRIIGASGFQFAALVGNIAQGGVQAEIAGRGLRAAFLKMTSGVPKVNKALRKIGVTLTDDTGKFKDVITIIAGLKKGLAGIKDEKDRLALQNIIFGRVGFVQMDTILARTEAQLRATTAAMAAQRGETRRIALLVRSTLLGVWIKFKSAMEGIGLIIFQRIKPGLKLMIRFFREVAVKVAASKDPLLIFAELLIKMTIVTKAWAVAQFILNKAFIQNPIFALISLLLILTTLYPDISAQILEFSDVILVLTIALTAYNLVTRAHIFFTKTAIGTGIAFRAVLLGQLLAQQLLTVGLAAVTAAQWLWNAALTANPIGIVVVGIGLLIAAIVGLVVFWDEIIDLFTSDWFTASFLTDPFTAFLSFLSLIFPDVIGKMLSKIKGMFSSVFGAIGDFLNFGDGDSAGIKLERTTDLNVNGDDVIDNITPSPAAAAFGEFQGQLDINFNNLPDGVDIASPGDLNSGLKISTSGF